MGFMFLEGSSGKLIAVILPIAEYVMQISFVGDTNAHFRMLNVRRKSAFVHQVFPMWSFDLESRRFLDHWNRFFMCVVRYGIIMRI